MRLHFCRIALLALAGFTATCKTYDPPSESNGTFEPCCGGEGMCVPAGFVPADTARQLAQGTCGSALLCAPKRFVEHPGSVPATCADPAGSEGRCLPSCLASVAAQTKRLQHESCGPSELCVPCYDPLKADDTGACRLNGDRPSQPARIYETCCRAQGRCVPRATLAATTDARDLERFGQDSCSTPADALCVPSAWLDEPDVRLESCRALGQSEGRCLPRCLPEVQKEASRLQRSTCAESDLCVPCSDPLTGEDTGACRHRGDMPAEPPGVFAACCEGQGRCVQRELIERMATAADLTNFDTHGCESEPATLCVPTRFLEDTTMSLTACRAQGLFEGRCLPKCLSNIAAQANRLEASTCSAGELCAPCYDPITGADTGACRTAMDAPLEPAQTFSRCCGARGRCVPRALAARSVASEQLSRLGREECEPASDALCIPPPFLSQPPDALARCTMPGAREGRCLPDCLPEVAQGASRLGKFGCAEGSLCVPCYDPLTGADTEACSLNGDAPQTRAAPYASCCAQAGRCVEREALLQSISPQDLAKLGALDCTAPDTLCVDSRWLTSGLTKLRECRTAIASEGRCLSQCLPDVMRQADLLQQGSCESGERCVPCYDPLNGADTGACRLGEDAGPREPPRVLERCCGAGMNARGACVPSMLIDEEQRGLLRVDSCQESDTLCAPLSLLDPSASTHSCMITSLVGATSTPGVCFSQCFVSPSVRALVQQASCDASEGCVPCSMLPASQAGCP